MYRNLLLPLAYRPGRKPEAEVRAARALAAPGARVTLLHVIGAAPEFRTEQTVTKEALARIVEQDLEGVAADFVQAEVKVMEGEPAEAILDLARSSGVDCIVLAPHRTDVGEYGSTAAQVVRRAHCTVHLVR